ncbi:acyltransferase family protein [Brachybacterium alimentarium]|uniref:acyltransferase family protein n=1 Tax=Brachybacterium alimentarium TaxID=47845 RepID=UPI003FCF03ED
MVSPRHAESARSATGAPASAGSAARPGYRPELHGLRGLAIGLVVVYHVWFDRVSGGVDVFLFLSAYFLTGTFLRRMEAGRPMAPFAYWARTFKRLLPPATLVILGTLAAAALLLPATTWMPAIHDGLGSLLQVQNWVLIQRDADYDAATGIDTSLLQHFWSLSIQGQVFLLWPFLFTLCAVTARRLHRSPRAVVAVGFGALALASFAWSVHSTATQQETAYFDTGARIWEFAAGTLLALVPAVTLPHRLRLLLGWAGLAVLVATGAVLDVESLFPGWIALIPLLGAALVVLAGSTASPVGADRLLSSRPAAFLGNISYALYLVHWPLLLMMLLRRDRESAGLVDGLLIIVLSLVLAHVLTRWVDTPVRRWTWANASAMRSAAAVLVVLVVGLAPTLAAQVKLERVEAEAEARAHADNPGARALDPDFTPDPEADGSAPTLPTEATLRDDRISLPEECTGEFAPEDPSVAEHCSSTAAPADAKVMVAVGSSRLGQAAASLIDPADANGWRVIVIRRPSCQFVPGTMTYAGKECFDHNLATLEYLRELQPDALVLNTTSYRGNGPESVSEAVEDSVPELLDQGTELIALRTLPRVPEDPIPCLEREETEADCTQPLDPEHMPSERADADALEQLSEHGTVHDVDLTERICPEHECPVQIGNVFVFYDTDHVTATYMQTLGDEADRQLSESGFRW